MPGRQLRPRVAQPVAPAQEWAPAEKKPSSYVPQLIGAIKSEDIESMCAYIEKGANLRNGIITSLCQSKNNCLRVLIERAEEIEVSCFNWWVINFYNFADPFYLGDDTEHYELLQALMAKCGPMNYCKDAMVQLARLVSRPAAAHEQLWHIISLALQKGAPAAIYSPETGRRSLRLLAARIIPLWWRCWRSADSAHSPHLISSEEEACPPWLASSSLCSFFDRVQA